MNSTRRRLAHCAIASIELFAVSSPSRAQKEQTLKVSQAEIDALVAIRKEAKLTNLPGAPAEQERRTFEPKLNDMLDRLLSGLSQNPNKRWVLEQVEPLIAEIYLEDTELREACVEYVVRVFKILSISSTGGAYAKYMLDL